MTSRTTVLLFLCGLLGAPAGAAVTDPNVSETAWASVGSAPTGMAWAPDGSGRLFVAQKQGTVRIVRMGPPPTIVATPFVTITPVFTNSECGLIGMAFDPDFRGNGYVYF